MMSLPKYATILALVLGASAAAAQGPVAAPAFDRPIEAGSWGGIVRNGPGMNYARIASLRESNCDAIDKAAAKIFDQVSAECDRKHDAFDAAERSRLMRHPLIVAAQKVRGKTATNALASVERQPSGAQKRSIRGARQ